MSSPVKNCLSTLSRRALFSTCAALTGVVFLANSPLHAEGLDRVYQVQANLTPTPLVAPTPVPATPLMLKVTPNDKKKTLRTVVDQGSNAYKISAYRIRVSLKSNDDGSNDNGTLFYSLSAAVEHTVGSHTFSLLPHSRGVIKLHQGTGQVDLPVNKYFSGNLSVKAIASNF